MLWLCSELFMNVGKEFANIPKNDFFLVEPKMFCFYIHLLETCLVLKTQFLLKIQTLRNLFSDDYSHGKNTNKMYRKNSNKPPVAYSLFALLGGGLFEGGA